LWQNLTKRRDGESIMIVDLPKAKSYNAAFLKQFESVKECVVNIRNIRQSKRVSPKESLSLFYKGDFEKEMFGVVEKMANVGTIESMNIKINDRLGVSFLVDKTEFFIPLEEKIDLNEELNKVNAELKYYNGFLENVMKKLSNEKFVSSAPKNIVDMELKKKQDAEDKIRKLSELKRSLTR